MNNKESSIQDKKVVCMPISGNIQAQALKAQFIKCNMCSQVIDQKKERIVDHIQLCTGF